jgi:HSP20 family molecular chaperone IbpA
MTTSPNDLMQREPQQASPGQQAPQGQAQQDAELPSLFPPVNISEDDAGITLTADLPGVNRESLSIRVDGDTLTLEAPIQLALERGMEPVYAELRAGRYRRSFTLSRELDSGHIEATLRDGVLTLRLPKLEQARPRRIEVRAA